MTTYSAQQYAENYPPRIEHYFWNIARNAIIARSLKRSGMDAWPLLEIGCGRGIVVEYLRDRGIACIGCELAAASIPDHLRDIVYDQTDFADLSVDQRRKIRGALLCDVIEHLPEPIAFLRKVRTALPALEGVLVTVPARHELWSEWDRHYGHFRRYDLGLLRTTLSSGRVQTALRWLLFPWTLLARLPTSRGGAPVDRRQSALALMASRHRWRVLPS
jgi:SAM-dependent methyltransferase